MTDELTSLERDVIGAMIASLNPPMPALVEQLASAKVARRELTGVGFYAKFVVPASVQRANTSEPEVRLTNVDAAIDGLQHGAGFVLYVADGLLDELECPGSVWTLAARSVDPRRATPRNE